MVVFYWEKSELLPLPLTNDQRKLLPLLADRRGSSTFL